MLIIGCTGAVLFAGIGALPIIYLAVLLRRRILPKSSLPVALAASHAIIVIVSIALYWVPIFWERPPFDDMYVPFILVPGAHIYFFGHWLGFHLTDASRPQLLSMMSSYDLSVLALVIIPGAVCLLLGTLQWYLLGHFWNAYLHKIWRLFRHKLWQGNSESKNQPVP